MSYECAEKYVRKYLRDAEGYIPGEQPRNIDEYIKLNTNENPYLPSPKALSNICSAADAQLRK